MIPRLRPAILLLVAPCLAALPLPLRAQEGQVGNTEREERPSFLAWSKGRAAERAGNLEDALAAYLQAQRDEPENAQYRERVQSLRFALAQSFTDRAERATLAGNLVEAASYLRRALSYDSESGVARERLRQLQRHAIEETTSIPEYTSAAPQLAPLPGTRDLDYRGDARGAYLEVARLFGLAALFDEDATKVHIRLQLSGVDFRAATDLLGEQTGTFLRALDEHTFLVVNDTLQKRREYLPQIERTLLLPESEKTEEMNEMVRAVREITGLTHTQLNTATRSLTVRGPEKAVALATALLRQLEQPRGEVVLEIDILEVDRNSAENLGIVPPSSAQVVTLSQQQLQLAEQSTNGLVQVIEELFGTPAAFAGSSTQQISSLLGTGGTSLSALVPPLVAFGGGQTIFLATLPGATANFASQLSVVRDAKRLLLRASDAEPVTFFVGSRYPINFSLLSGTYSNQANQPGIIIGATSVGQSPRGVLTTSLRTGNTFFDVVTANHDAGTVSVLLGNGNGSFQPHVDYPAGTNPVAVAAATFRASGQPVDLAVVDQGTNSVQILLGNGDGTFQSPVSYAVGTLPSGLVLGDFNTDGHTDIAVTNTNDNTISLLFGNGDGTFQPAKTVALTSGQGPVGIASADFNSDSHADLVVTDSATNMVTILFGDGAGNFPSQTDVSTGTLPVAVATADLNGDGLPDFVVANKTDGTVSVFLNTGTPASGATPGTAVFSSRTDIPVGSQPDAVIAGDFNSDGAQDLVVANSGDATVTALFGEGNGTFPANIVLPTGNGPAGLASADFNADGLPDLAVTNETDNTVSIVINSRTIAISNPQLPYPGIQFEDIGVKAKATPRIHPSGDVTLALNFEIRSLSAVSYNGIPAQTNRTIEQTVRLHQNEPSVLAGIFSDNQTLTVTGWPGAAEVPGLDVLTSNRNPQIQQTELVIVVIPRVVRLAPRVTKVFYAGHERQSGVGAGAGGVETPETPQPAPFQQQPPQPVPPPPATPPTTPPGERPQQQP